MSSKNCSGCHGAIKSREYLQCPQCEQLYDLECANISSREFKSLTSEHRRIWKCPDCLSKQRKCGDNTNTPIRRANNTQNFTSTSNVAPDECANNVTLRTKAQLHPTIAATQSYVTEERLRDILRQEITDMLKATIKELVTKDLTNINNQISTFHESLNFFNDCFESLKKDIEEKTATIKTLQTDNANLQATVSDLSER
ncbi:unnamed protein product [Euphydryas editha]|uniref:PHD-type domain-containing protein n=1 Tax=Euphydryas editha TaxID=104508 RepID=A0AAU9UDM7_EUPED|nr:unnamed protein product [Euphydryas editha]